MKSFYGDYNESRFDSQKTTDVISVPSSPDDKSPIEIADSNEVHKDKKYVCLTIFYSEEDKNGFTSVSKFKPRSKKIIGKIKMNLKQSHSASDEVRFF